MLLVARTIFLLAESATGLYSDHVCTCICMYGSAMMQAGNRTVQGMGAKVEVLAATLLCYKLSWYI